MLHIRWVLAKLIQISGLVFLSSTKTILEENVATTKSLRTRWTPRIQGKNIIYTMLLMWFYLLWGLTCYKFFLHLALVHKTCNNLCFDAHLKHVNKRAEKNHVVQVLGYDYEVQVIKSPQCPDLSSGISTFTFGAFRCISVHEELIESKLSSETKLLPVCPWSTHNSRLNIS